MEKGFDIQTAINIEDINNVICINLNEMDVDLFAEAFYDIYIK